MNKEIVESIADYFKNKYMLLAISVDNVCVKNYYGIIDLEYKDSTVFIARMWLESENIDLYLYNKTAYKTTYYRWNINDPKCITEIEKYIERHIERYRKI